MIISRWAFWNLLACISPPCTLSFWFWIFQKLGAVQYRVNKEFSLPHLSSSKHRQFSCRYHSLKNPEHQKWSSRPLVSWTKLGLECCFDIGVGRSIYLAGHLRFVSREERNTDISLGIGSSSGCQVSSFRPFLKRDNYCGWMVHTRFRNGWELWSHALAGRKESNKFSEIWFTKVGGGRDGEDHTTSLLDSVSLWKGGRYSTLIPQLVTTYAFNWPPSEKSRTLPFRLGDGPWNSQAGSKPVGGEVGL